MIDMEKSQNKSGSNLLPKAVTGYFYCGFLATGFEIFY